MEVILVCRQVILLHTQIHWWWRLGVGTARRSFLRSVGCWDEMREQSSSTLRMKLTLNSICLSINSFYLLYFVENGAVFYARCAELVLALTSLQHAVFHKADCFRFL
jgi:hypothetical protein